MTGPELNSNEMAKKRTDMAEHRTGLSEHRTDLSEHRTSLSEHRTEMGEQRSQLATMRSHLANERTHLAYMRTGISLISFGITINRFAWFLIDNKSLARYGHSFLHDTKNLGIGMVFLGCAMLIWSLFNYRNTAKSIQSNIYHPSHRSVLSFTLVLILVGVVSTVWLILG
ncbi:YidH family protein [Bdellovibrio bacteriovorus]|uniref:YidH family protein n=1 Tax=Bdellovibrio bacteriovorus TaxID=959 RepID=UPI0035A7394A